MAKEYQRYLKGDEITPKSVNEMQQGLIAGLEEILAALKTDEELQVAAVFNVSIRQRPDLDGAHIIGYPGVCRYLAQQLFQVSLSLPPDPNFEPPIVFEKKA